MVALLLSKGGNFMSQCQSKRPKIKPSKAIVGALPVTMLNNINPATTPAKAYIKKTK